MVTLRNKIDGKWRYQGLVKYGDITNIEFSFDEPQMWFINQQTMFQVLNYIVSNMYKEYNSCEEIINMGLAEVCSYEQYSLHC